MAVKEEHEYVLGSSDREIERLEFQHGVWSGPTSRLWDQAGIDEGASVVDLGCGPGLCSAELLARVGASGSVYAVDESAKFAAIVSDRFKSAGNFAFEKCDVASTGASDDSFDFVFARWLFCFLTRPEEVIREAHRILKPDGKLVVLDYFNYLAANVFPKNERITALFEAFAQDVESHGGTYDVGERLPVLIKKEGFEIESLEPITRIAKPGSDTWRWVEFFQEVAVPRIVESGIWSDAERTELETEWTAARNSPGAFLFSPPMIGIVAIRGK